MIQEAQVQTSSLSIRTARLCVEVLNIAVFWGTVHIGCFSEGKCANSSKGQAERAGVECTVAQVPVFEAYRK